MTHPLISIIVPCFNCEHTIERTVGSLVMQAYQNIEILLIDDGSTDATSSIIDAIAEHDNRIVVQHTVNRGVSHARNYDLELAKGSFVIFVDSDDALETDILQRAAATQESFDADMVIFGHADIVQENQRINRRDYSTNNLIDLSFTQRDESFFQVMFTLENSRYLFSCWGKLIRKSWIAGIRFDPDINYGEDTTWILTLLQQEGHITALPDVGYLYYGSSQGLLNSFSKHKFSSIVKAHQQQVKFYLWKRMSDEYQQLVQLRLTNDVFWALQTLKAADDSVSSQERVQLATILTHSPLRPLYLRNIELAATSRYLKILFMIDSNLLWKLYLR